VGGLKPPFESVLVANRGEIAVRVLRGVKALGARAIAVYSDADRAARHVREADEAVRIGPAPAAESYLSVTAVVAAAKKTGAKALHPGYGFLSERADLAAACEAAGVVFVGPPASVLEATGDKVGVKARVARAGVPVIPGPEGALGAGPAALRAAATATGFPMLLKAVGGGGGRGMRRVDREADLEAAAESATREASGAFGDARLYAEALVRPARHVEVQVLCDARGEVRVVGDRDCSVQRRHQKVVEECPAPGLSAATRGALHDAARKAAKALGYRNAGTVEFLVDLAGRVFFLEVNRRLQVEHPVTERVHGLDLVEWQLRVAAGEALPAEGTWPARGHAVEARVNAEDPERGFVPSPGTVRRVVEPSGEGVRVDSGLGETGVVTPHYDSLLMKVIAHAPTRAEAIARLDAALSRTAVIGVASNVAFLRRVLAAPAFRDARLSTDLLSEPLGTPPGGEATALDALLAASVAEALGVGNEGAAGEAGRGRARPDPWRTLAGWRVRGGGA
jgi:acetyl-CoA/propionyl-CoA carboxylase biotin carboxyl carrier protein